MQTDHVSYCEEHFYHAFNRPVSTMNNNNARKNLDMLKVMDEIVAFAKEKDLYEQLSYDLEYMTIEHILITSIKREIINQMRKYVLQHYPNFRKDKAFQEFNKKQQMVAVLNAYGLSCVSRLIFVCKGILKSKK